MLAHFENDYKSLMSLSEEERRFTADYYGLPSLDCPEWVELGAVRVSRDDLSSSAGLQLEAVEDVAAVAESMSMARALLQEDRDPLGISDDAYRQAAESMRPSTALRLTSRHFSPPTFLARTHGTTRIGDLRKGEENLARAVKERDNVIRELVRQNFSRFVKAKADIDAVFADMHGRGLIGRGGDGGDSRDTNLTRQAGERLAEAVDTASRIFDPITERAAAISNIKHRLAFLQRYAPVFLAGRRIGEAGEAGDMTAAVSEYRRARGYLHEGAAPKSVLQPFWAAQVEPQVERVRQQLLQSLHAAGAFGDVLRHLAMLRAIDTVPDPLPAWFSHYHRQCIAAVEKTVRLPRDLISECRESWAGQSPDDRLAMLSTGLRLVCGRERLSAPLALCRLDYLAVAEWQQAETFFVVVGDLLSRVGGMLADFAESLAEGRVVGSGGGVDPESITNLLSEMAVKVEEGLEEIWGELDPSLPSLPMAIFAARHLRHLRLEMGSDLVRPVIHSLTLLFHRFLIRQVWQAGIIDASLITRMECGDGDDDEGGEGDESTILTRRVEGLYTFLIAQTAGIQDALLASLGRQLTGRETPIAGIDRWLADGLRAFIGALKDIIIDRKEGGSGMDGGKGTIHGTGTSLPSLAPPYQLLTVLTNLMHLRHVTLPRLLTLLPSIAGVRGVTDSMVCRVVIN